MRFGRRPDADRRGAIIAGSTATPAERLVRRTTLGLALTTLALIAALLAAVGVITVAAATQASDQLVDRNLAASANTMLQVLRPTPTPAPSSEPTGGPTDVPTAEPETTGEAPDNGAGERDEGGAPTIPAAQPTPGPTAPSPTPQPTVAPTSTPSPSAAAALPTGGTSGGTTPAEEDARLGSSDTFFLVLDTNGKVTANPQRITLPTLPDTAAVAAALANGVDWRTVSAGGDQVRLLTQLITDQEDQPVGVLQSGFVLNFYDELSRQLTFTIALVSLIGLLGAAFVTLLVTQRALSPIRSAFAAERRFVAAASHELRTPIAVVRASAEILQREELVKPDGRQVVDDIVAESDRLGRLVGDLLALASAEAGQISIVRRDLEMRVFVAELAHRVESMAAASGVRVEVVQEGTQLPADRQLIVSADADRMMQLLLIFIDNAIDHSPRDGVVRLVVQPVIEAGRPAVSVGVIDQGPGVPATERERIFEPFARLGGQRRRGGGSGLGLAIARLLAARQDATLHVDDAVGGGAVFSVTLPRRLPRKSPTAA